MNGSVFVILFLSLYDVHQGFSQLNCYDCQGGPQTNCARVLMTGAGIPCTGKNAQCYEAFVEYQNGALPLVQRRCWTPPNNTNATDFCKWFNNPNGSLKTCTSCKTDLCNTNTNFWATSKS